MPRPMPRELPVMRAYFPLCAMTPPGRAVADKDAGRTPPCNYSRIKRGSVGPQPSESAGREERVNQSVHGGLDGGEPGAAVPDRHLPHRERVADERCDAHEPAQRASDRGGER